MAKLLVGYLFLAIAFDKYIAYADYDGSKKFPNQAMQEADGKTLHLYALPVGQGEAQVLQCPNGDITIIDLGSSEVEKSGFWTTREIQNFLLGHYHRIVNIVITHNHVDHFSFFKDVFNPSALLTGLKNIYISCTRDDMYDTLKTWINGLDTPQTKLKMFNAGNACGSSHLQYKPCDEITLCPENTLINATVLSANAGNCNKYSKPIKSYNKNIDSIVIGIKFGDFSMQLNGDFEEVSKMINCNSDLQVTVYKLAHHGADKKANTHDMCDAVRPRAVYVSSNPWFTYRHPRCSVTDYFIEKDYLCQPAVTDRNNKSYCGDHPISQLSVSYTLQEKFACGLDRKLLHLVTTNRYAIYSTTPSENKINLVHLLTDGIKWGFVNSIRSKIERNQPYVHSNEF